LVNISPLLKSVLDATYEAARKEVNTIVV